jgi:hypothetical protein
MDTGCGVASILLYFTLEARMAARISALNSRVI